MKSKKLIDSNGNVKVPFYHGTSSLFIPSIQEAGLGGRNPVNDNKWVESFGDLFELARQKLGDTPEWPKYRKSLGPIVEQGLSKDGNRHNYSHGETYISPNSSIAARYAMESGCEILYYLRSLSNDLALRGYGSDVQRVLPMNLQNTLHQTYRPFLVRISGLRFRDIDTENGDDKTTVLRQYEEFLRTNQGTTDMTSWKLITTIPKGQLKFLPLSTDL